MHNHSSHSLKKYSEIRAPTRPAKTPYTYFGTEETIQYKISLGGETNDIILSRDQYNLVTYTNRS